MHAFLIRRSASKSWMARTSPTSGRWRNAGGIREMIEWFEDFTLGMKFKSGALKVTEGDITRFAAEFDPQPMHLDDAAARKTLFKGLAASGWHTAAMAMSLTVQIRPFGSHPLIGLGVDNLRWMAPVRPG